MSPPFIRRSRAEAGAVFDPATGDLLHTLTRPGAVADDHFGESIAGIGDNVLVGAINADLGAINTGAAYLFDPRTGALLRTLSQAENGTCFVAVFAAGGIQRHDAGQLRAKGD